MPKSRQADTIRAELNSVSLSEGSLGLEIRRFSKCLSERDFPASACVDLA